MLPTFYELFFNNLLFNIKWKISAAMVFNRKNESSEHIYKVTQNINTRIRLELESNQELWQ